jgi:hypothetical protein
LAVDELTATSDGGVVVCSPTGTFEKRALMSLLRKANVRLLRPACQAA